MFQYRIKNVITGEENVDIDELAKDWAARGKLFKWKSLFAGELTDLKIVLA
jgi:hypothetical protein